MYVVIAVVPAALDAAGHGELDSVVERRRRIRAALSGGRTGDLLDGAWTLVDDLDLALEAALSAAQAGGAAALADGGRLQADPPISAEVLWTEAAARSARAGEVLVPAALSGQLGLPTGVAKQTAPGALSTGLGAVDLLRDYREA